MEKPQQVLEAQMLQTVICQLCTAQLVEPLDGKHLLVSGWPFLCDTRDFHTNDSQTWIASARVSHERFMSPAFFI